MNDTGFAPEQDRRPHTMLEQHLVVGAHTYQITASGTGGEKVSLSLYGWGPEGAVVSEMSGGISSLDLPAVAEALSSTLAGLVAMRSPGKVVKAKAAVERPKRYPNRGTRWSTEDDALLLARFRGGCTERALMEEFGRSRGGIRARLETLGEIEPDAGSPFRGRDTAGGAETAEPPDAEVAVEPE
ncbi:hypothetical protein [Actinoplanes sp. NPDC051494]|uniref:hypothetical protein n=1 Tax=Actinoplanes sp. NPDC051494 TaxID=3363907 RepID=UPI003798763C